MNRSNQKQWGSISKQKNESEPSSQRCRLFAGIRGRMLVQSKHGERRQREEKEARSSSAHWDSRCFVTARINPANSPVLILFILFPLSPFVTSPCTLLIFFCPGSKRERERESERGKRATRMDTPSFCNLMTSLKYG